jgi:alkylmercury lyase
MTEKSADGVALTLTESMPPLGSEERRLALALMRMLAGGEPVSPAAFAERVGLDPRAVEPLVDEAPDLQRDSDGRVIGFLGISLTETPHRFEVDGATLYAWCAWDTLFLPRIIGRAAAVRSTCRQTGEAVALTVSPTAVEELSPRGAVVSMLVPERGFGGDVIESFCRHVHVFVDREAGERWLAGRDGEDAFCLTVAEAFRLGRLWTEHWLGEASA